MTNKKEQSINIILIRQRYNPFGGAERFVERAIQSLHEKNIKLTLITRSWNAKNASEHRIEICNPFYVGSIWRDWIFSHCVCKKIKNTTCDLIQSHERIACCDIYRAGDGVHREWLQQRKRGANWLSKLSITLNPYHYYVKFAEKKLFSSKQLKMIICNSYMVKKEIQYYFDVPDDKIQVIYNGVDSNKFYPNTMSNYKREIRQKYQIPFDATLLIFVGSGFERKGLNTTILALSKCNSETHLIIIGTDKRIKKYQKITQDLNLTDRVHFLGGQQDVTKFYQAADIFILPTLYDPFPNTALEAMACALPVIISHKSGAAEIIRQGENGYVFDALDIDSIKETINLLTNYNLRKKIGLNALESSKQMSLNHMSNKLSDLYSKTITQNNQVIDVVLIATMRPEILRITLNSFNHKMLKNIKKRLIVNIDPIGDKNTKQLDIINICKDYFSDIQYNTPSTASFSKAVQWAWSQVKSDIFLHLEDDWCLKKDVDINTIKMKFNKKDIVSVRLNVTQNTENLYSTFSLNPSIFRTSYIKEILTRFDENKDPEKQFRTNQNSQSYQTPIFILYGKKFEKSFVIDTGKKWRKSRGFQKWETSHEKISWNKKSMSQIKSNILNIKYKIFLIYWTLMYCQKNQ